MGRLCVTVYLVALDHYSVYMTILRLVGCSVQLRVVGCNVQLRGVGCNVSTRGSYL